MKPRVARVRPSLEVFALASTSVEPCRSTFYHPPQERRLEAVTVRLPTHHEQQPATDAPGPLYQPAGIAHSLGDRPSSLALSRSWTLAVCTATAGISTRVFRYDVVLASGDLLACVVASGPPFAVVLTDWLSVMAALGEAARPSASRTRARNASSARSQAPSSRQLRKCHKPCPTAASRGASCARGMLPRNTYSIPFTASRKSRVRGCPWRLLGDSKGANSAHWASVKYPRYNLRCTPPRTSPILPSTQVVIRRVYPAVTSPVMDVCAVLR